MIGIAILIAIIGGFFARGLGFSKQLHRIFAFAVPVCICTALLQIPILLAMLRAHHFPRVWEVLKALPAEQFLMLLYSFILTGFGWLCAYVIQKTFED